MRLLLVPDVTAPNGLDAFCESVAKRAPSRGHQAAVETAPGSAAELAKRGFARDYDVVLVNSVQPGPIEAARALGKKTVLRLVDSFAGVEQELFEQAQNLVGRADLVLVPSRYLESLARSWETSAPIEVVPYAYEQILAQQIALVTVRSARTAFHILAGGTINAATQPGFEALLSAAARLRLDWHLSIFGDGPALGALTARAEQLVAAGKVSFLGAISHPKIMEFLRGSKVYVEPCGVDGFPVFALHALSQGCPVVAVRAGANAEVLVDNENCLLVSPGNPAALSEAIVTLASVSGLSLRLIAGGIKTVEGRSWDATCDAVFAAIGKLAPRGVA